MKLIRIAILTLKINTGQWDDCKKVFPVEDVNVTLHEIDQVSQTYGQQMIVRAVTKMTGLPDLDPANGIIVPKAERGKTEEAIEIVANLISLSKRCPRTITSPPKCIAFLGESPEEKRWLSSTSGIIPTRSESAAEVPFSFELRDDHLQLLSDRLLGVALLAEVLAQIHPLGKFRELVRFFELAFGLEVRQGSRLEKKLSQFLKTSGLDFRREEVNQWFSYRDGAIHGDLKKTHRLVLESDVVRLIYRMELAAYDVLLNKTDWHNASQTRRSIWRPKAAFLPNQGQLKVTPGEKIGMDIALYDEFDTYPLNLSVGVKDCLPTNAWSEWRWE